MKPYCAVVLGMLLVSHSFAARADAGFWAGAEYLHWEEKTSPKVTEKGPIFAFGFNWTQAKAEGLVFAYQGKLYTGSVKYEGALLFSPSTPVTGTTQYTGMQHEGQLRLRKSKSDYTIDPYVGLGVNNWNRELSAVQREVYTVFYASAGLQFDRPQAHGLTGGFGVRYAFYIDENAYFRDLGYDNNPHLKPKGQVSAFANVGYRFKNNLELSGYYESIRFNDSDPVSVSQNGAAAGAFYQPGSKLDILGLRLQYRFAVN